VLCPVAPATDIAIFAFITALGSSANKDKKGVKVAQLVDILKDARAGDMLLEVKTSDGDVVNITLE